MRERERESIIGKKENVRKKSWKEASRCKEERKEGSRVHISLMVYCGPLPFAFFFPLNTPL